MESPTRSNELGIHEQPITTFDCLPPDILRCITDHLLPPDAASLSLVNRKSSNVLGPVYWPLLRTCLPSTNESSHRWLFLATLSYDLNDLLLCHWCSRFHHVSRISPSGPAFRSLKSSHPPPQHPPPSVQETLAAVTCLQPQARQPSLRWLLCAHRCHTLYSFQYEHLQLAMKRYRYGESHGISPEELEYVEVVEPMVEGYGVVKKEEEKVTTLLSVDARIIPSSLPSLQAEDQNAISAKPSARLYLRIQQWTLPLFHPFTSFSTLTTALKSFSPIYSVCEHFAVQDRVGGPHAFRSDRCYWPRSDGEIDHGNLSPLTEKVIEEYSVRNGNKEESKPVFHYCERCGVDFELEVRNIEEHGQFSGHKRRRAFVITKNLDLSPSHSLNRPSIQYDKGQMSENLLEFLADRHSIPFKAGEAKKAFENAEGELEKEDLCERNAGLLRGRKYKRVLGEWKPKIWILQAGRKVPSRAPDFPWNRWGIALVITTAVEICWIVFSANNIGRMIDSLCVDRGFLGTGCWVCKGEWEAWVILVGAVLVAEVGWVLATTTKRDLRRILLILGHDGLSDTWPWDRDEHGWLI